MQNPADAMNACRATEMRRSYEPGTEQPHFAGDSSRNASLTPIFNRSQTFVTIVAERSVFHEDEAVTRDQNWSLLQPEGKGILLLLMTECRLRGSIPANEHDVATVVGYRYDLFFSQHWRIIKKFFEPTRDKDRLVCPLVEAERRRRVRRIEIARERGAAGAQRRWHSTQQQTKPPASVIGFKNNEMDGTSIGCAIAQAWGEEDLFSITHNSKLQDGSSLAADDAAAAAAPAETQSLGANGSEPKQRRNGNRGGKQPRSRRGMPSALEVPPPERYEVTDDLRALVAREKLPLVDIQAEVDACLDWFRAAGVRRADWPATIRNWIRGGKLKGYRAPINQPQQQTQPVMRIGGSQREQYESKAEGRERRNREAASRATEDVIAVACLKFQN